MDAVIKEKLNLLIVDDEENIITLESSLANENFNIFSTQNVESAFQICIDNEIAIAMITIEMPGIEGYELIEKIKSNPLTAHILIIFTVYYSNNSNAVVRGLASGAIDYLYKPFNKTTTKAKINLLVTIYNFQREVNLNTIKLQESQDELLKAIDQAKNSAKIKENFLANMSHEIRTPLNAITGLINLLKDSSIDTHQKKLIRLMGFSSSALLGIVNDILESAKIDAGKVEIVKTRTNIIKLINTICDLIKPMANEKGLNLSCVISDNTPTYIMADSLRINQILFNIINNSIKFTINGSVVIRLEPLEFKEDRVLMSFSVEDTGIGISKEAIKTIFTRFEQVEDKTWQQFGGTGLGLSIVKRLIELKGGELHIESVLGSGTKLTFTNWFTLAEDDGVAILEDKNDNQQISDDDILILLVDDNPVSQFIVVEMLKEWNIMVDVASDGSEAFEMLKAKNYKLILMDTHMPVMNGNEATRKIRMNSSKKDIPIISFSASVIEKEKNEAIDAGVDDFIDKPFEPNSLVKKIRKLTKKN